MKDQDAQSDGRRGRHLKLIKGGAGRPGESGPEASRSASSPLPSDENLFGVDSIAPGTDSQASQSAPPGRQDRRDPQLPSDQQPGSHRGDNSESEPGGFSGPSQKSRSSLSPEMGLEIGETGGPGLSDLLTDGDERALSRYLSIRERAPVEVRQYLTKRGILKSWHDSILERLMEMDLLNEERFCANRIEHRLNSGQGPRRIQQELGSLGIDRHVARDCLEAVQRHTWEENCLEVASAKLEGIMDREDSYWKLLQFLNYRGFESVHIEWAMAALKEKYPLWAKRSSGSP